jgi:hypothetical protein
VVCGCLVWILDILLKKIKKLVNLFSHSSSLGKIKLKNFRLYSKKEQDTIENGKH